MVSLEDFEIVKTIYRSDNGAVYKAKKKIDGRIYALKERKCAELGGKRDMMNEANLLQQLHHPNIIRCYGHFWQTSTGALFLILEYLSGGDLHHEIRRRAKAGKPFKEATIWTIFYQICKAISYLHSKGIVHRDIKALNVMLCGSSADQPQAVKIVDLGVSREVTQETLMLHTCYGTPLYASPELCQNRPYTEKTDIWSLGILLYEMAGLRHPFNATSLIGLSQAIVKGHYAPLPAHVSRELSTAVKHLLQVDFSLRPSMAEVMTWFNVNETGKEENTSTKDPKDKRQYGRSDSAKSQSDHQRRSSNPQGYDARRRSLEHREGQKSNANLTNMERMKLENELKRAQLTLKNAKKNDLGGNPQVVKSIKDTEKKIKALLAKIEGRPEEEEEERQNNGDETRHNKLPEAIGGSGPNQVWGEAAEAPHSSSMNARDRRFEERRNQHRAQRVQTPPPQSQAQSPQRHQRPASAMPSLPDPSSSAAGAANGPSALQLLRQVNQERATTPTAPGSRPQAQPTPGYGAEPQKVFGERPPAKPAPGTYIPPSVAAFDPNPNPRNPPPDRGHRQPANLLERKTPNDRRHPPRPRTEEDHHRYHHYNPSQPLKMMEYGDRQPSEDWDRKLKPLTNRSLYGDHPSYEEGFRMAPTSPHDDEIFGRGRRRKQDSRHSTRTLNIITGQWSDR